jgi:hypothetical protein
MRTFNHRHLLGGVLLVAGCAILLSGCMGFGGDSSSKDTTPSTLKHAQVGTTIAVADAGEQPIIVSPADKYSNFQSKDPFVQQAEPTTSTDNTPATTTPSATSTTTTTNSSTSSTTTTSSTSTTSTSSTTSTTSFFTHMLQVLSIAVVDGSDAVTFQVDNTVYENQHIGDTVSTSWGTVKVVGIDTGAKVVNLLHDSQTLTLTEHQILFE